MSLSILDTPQDFQPVYSDGLFFTISGDTTNKFKFRYVYDIYVEGNLVFQGKSTPNPYSLGVIDVSRIVKTYTENIPISLYNTTPIFTHQTFPYSRPYADETINYQVFFGYEYSSTADGSVTGFTGNGNDTSADVGPPSVDSGLYKTFYSTMGVNGRATQQDFNIDPFVLSGTPVGINPTTSGLFLTNSPRTRDVRSEDYYTLGFTNYYLNSSSMLSEPYYVEYKFYDDDGVLLDTKQYQNILTNGGGPLADCSAVYPSYYNIVTTGNTDWNTLYVGAGPMNLNSIMPANTAQYTVQLFGKFTGTTTPIQPSPTPTPTPSSTPGCAQCYVYDVYNPSLILNANISYIECNRGPTRTISIPPNSYARIDCACDGSLIYETALVVTIVDACGGAPTPTPTPTPSATPCMCESYQVENTGLEAAITVDFLDCDRVAQQLIIPPGIVQVFCACMGSVVVSGGSYDLTDLGPCGAPTPTPTPTPSSTPECIPQTVFECTNTCVGGECFCDSPFEVTVYAAPGVLPSDEGETLYTDCGLTEIYYGQYQYGGIIYDASPITIVCLPGGGC